ncbi:DUF1501 domain-containing protein [Myxococcus sp. CA056]|uniref:DUF1501 domain-containing protein n=1 Tax=unclassified Myxococcus TaxID=2648731 RepID=UPI00157AA5A6|nr:MULTISPECIES: DUF1501 domain-containing protein [unclassified Myxococcus]NTX16141.1 DUF1501 domain-containing protein [Myxococcus sp. CA056]NTX39821.1 DUF1501 domain-containing protein [Myxococcus sp. CA033]
MPNTSRRTLLKWALGAGQFALLDRAGLLGAGLAHAADADVPSRLVVLYVPGGFRPAYCFTPMEDSEIPLCVPGSSNFSSEPVFYDASKVVNLAPANGAYKPLRTWQSWNPQDPAARGTFSPLMYGYQHFALHEQLSVLHGIDQGTNDHASAFISAMCGVAGADYRAPAMHSVIANHLYARHRETRPLPFVVVAGDRGVPSGMGLPSHASPVGVPSIDALKPMLSGKAADNAWWSGLEARTEGAELDARGTPTGAQLKTTTVERYSLARAQPLLGRSTAKVDNYLEGLHGSLSSVSRVLATDVVSLLEGTKGIDTLKTNRPAYLSSYLNETFTYTFGNANFHLTGLDPRMDMALRLLKSDLCTSVHVSLRMDFDTHSGAGHAFSCAHGRGLMDCVARFLGEMKATPAPGKPGKTLLDDTLVLVMSEFGRSWASRANDGSYNLPDDHHPYTSVFFAGGNVAANRQVGTYTTRGLGVPVDIIEETGQTQKRVPRSADVVTTALRIMGMEPNEFFIPGGYGEVVGLRKG